MASDTIILVSLLVLVSILNFATTKAQGPTYTYKFCSKDKTTANSAFHADLKTLLSSLSSNGATAGFYNTTITGRNTSDTVYGLFMCRGDFSSCGQCVGNATQKLSSDSDCSLSNEAVIWYDECMVRYSNRSFFSIVATRPGVYLLNTANISNQDSFMRLLFKTINQTADEAASSPVLAKKYATKEASISGFQNLYSMAQCTEDLSPQDCRNCLSDAIGNLPTCCEGKQGGRVLFPSCNVRYELYPFYSTATPEPTPAPAGLVPATNTSDADSKYSEDPGYLSHNCSSNETFTETSAFQSYLSTLLSHLSSNATSGGKLFKREEVEDTVYGLFMCRGDMPPRLCGQCVLNATSRISSECRFSKEAIIWYSHCLLRYSFRYFFPKADTSPRFQELNITSSFNPTQEQNFFSVTLSNTLNNMAMEAGDNDNRYAVESLKLNPVF